jgi:predicted Zn-dependent peptidase
MKMPRLLETRLPGGPMPKRTLALLLALPLLLAPVTAYGGTEIEIHRYSLDNGLTLLVLEDHSLPIISYQVWYRVGSRNERPGITGISHLFEHMMFKGSKKFGPEDHARLVNANGGSLNAFTTEDVTAYFENLPADRLELAIELEAERQANLAINEQNLESERQVVKEERRLRTDNSNFGRLIEQLQAIAYQQHPYQWPVVGWMSDLDRITVEDCVDYFHTHYAPNNTTVVVVGDVVPDEVFRLVRKHYRKMKAGPPADAGFTKEEEQKGERRAIFRKPAQLPWLGIAYHIPEETHEDAFVLEVIDNILSSGKSSRIYQDLVYDREMALFAFSTADLRIDPGLFFVVVGDIKPEHTPAEVEAAVKAQLRRLAEEPVTEAELQKAKNQLEAGFVFDLQSNFGKGMQIARSFLFAGDPYYFRNVVDKYRAVTPEDIMRVAGTYFRDDNATVVTLLPEEIEGLKVERVE